MLTLLPDQAAELRAAMHRNRVGDLAAITQAVAPVEHAVGDFSRPAARIIAIASGKGGVGKTHLSVNLALLLGRLGHRVTLIDLDVGTANVDVLLNLPPHATLGDFVNGRVSADQLARTVAPSVRIITGTSGESRAAEYALTDPVQLAHTLRVLAAPSDLMLLDCGAGIGPLVRAVAQQADVLTVITTPEPTSITDAYALLKVTQPARKPSQSVGIVVNQAQSATNADVVANRIISASWRFLSQQVSNWGAMRFDKHVPQAGYQRRAFTQLYPNCKASSDLGCVAGRISAIAKLSGTSVNALPVSELTGRQLEQTSQLSVKTLIGRFFPLSLGT